MSEVTEIKQASKGNDRYHIFLDGNYFCTLNAETVIKAGLKSGKDVSKEEIEDIQAENERLVALDKSFRYLTNLKTEKQIKDYLYSKGYTSKTVNYCIAKLHDYNYINDEEFTKMYVKSYIEKKGKRLIEFELKSKGVKIETIKKVLESLPENSEILGNLALKFLKNKPRDKKTAQKLFAHLSSKGFEFEEINKIIRKYVFDFENND